MALLSDKSLEKASINYMNLLGGDYLIRFWLVLTKFDKSSIDFSRLFHSFVWVSDTICLNSSISMGSIGLETNACFLNALDVVLNPVPEPKLELLTAVAFINDYYMLKSEVDVNFPKPSLPPAGLYFVV